MGRYKWAVGYPTPAYICSFPCYKLPSNYPSPRRHCNSCLPLPGRSFREWPGCPVGNVMRVSRKWGPSRTMGIHPLLWGVARKKYHSFGFLGFGATLSQSVHGGARLKCCFCGFGKSDLWPCGTCTEGLSCTSRVLGSGFWQACLSRMGYPSSYSTGPIPGYFSVGPCIGLPNFVAVGVAKSYICIRLDTRCRLYFTTIPATQSDRFVTIPVFPETSSSGKAGQGPLPGSFCANFIPR